MSKIQLNKNQKEVLFIVALFLVPFLDPGFALLLGLILSLTIGHPFLAINSRITHILLQISVVGLGFGMNVEQAIEAGKTHACRNGRDSERTSAGMVCRCKSGGRDSRGFNAIVYY